MKDSRLDEVRDQLAKIEPADIAAKAHLWRDAYRKLLSYTLHGMHKIAWESQFASLTQGDWIYEPGIEDFDPNVTSSGTPLPVLKVTSTQFYRGFALEISVKNDRDQWQYFVVGREETGDVAFETFEAGFESVEAAYHAGIQKAMIKADVRRG